jgi:hypothetical protein
MSKSIKRLLAVIIALLILYYVFMSKNKNFEIDDTVNGSKSGYIEYRLPNASRSGGYHSIMRFLYKTNTQVFTKDGEG